MQGIQIPDVIWKVVDVRLSKSIPSKDIQSADSKTKIRPDIKIFIDVLEAQTVSYPFQLMNTDIWIGAFWNYQINLYFQQSKSYTVVYLSRYNRIKGAYYTHSQYLVRSISVKYRMNTTQLSLFNCSTCSASFEAEDLYKEHYKSEFHRYNLKRKMINLPPTSYQQYIEQFENPRSNSSTNADYKCEICSKTFLSPNTYSHHLNSKKHKHSRDRIMNKSSQKPLSKSNSQSSSDFSIISHHQKNHTEKCLFCNTQISEEHLKLHNFPPFKYNCNDFPGLLKYVSEIINSHKCLYCKAEFSSAEAAKQHMAEVGHSKINTEDFSEFEQFYDWTIKQEQNESQQQWEVVEELGSKQKPTLKDLQMRRKQRIVLTNTGARINGRLVGLRAYKKYYNQYFRLMVPIDRSTKAITNNHNDAPMKMVVPRANCIRA